MVVDTPRRNERLARRSDDEERGRREAARGPMYEGPEESNQQRRTASLDESER